MKRHIDQKSAMVITGLASEHSGGVEKVSNAERAASSFLLVCLSTVSICLLICWIYFANGITGQTTENRHNDIFINDFREKDTIAMQVLFYSAEIIKSRSRTSILVTKQANDKSESITNVINPFNRGFKEHNKCLTGRDRGSVATPPAPWSGVYYSSLV